MKKFVKYVFVYLVSVFLFTGSVFAANESVSISTGTKVAAVGSTFTVKVKVNSTAKLGSWEFGITYDSSYISLVGGSPTHVVESNSTASMKTPEYTYTFKAIKSGNANIRVSNPQIVLWDNTKDIITPGERSVSVTVKTQAEIQASYSKNNDLKSLSVEGYEISPAFDKDTLEYMVSVPDTETQIKVNASVADSKSRVSGTGTIDISEGANTVSIVVTAENGSTKTYTLNVDVKDLNPIEAHVDGETYTLVKKSDLLTEAVGFTLSTITIEGLEIPAYKSELAGLTLVGLKDSVGKVAMFIYDENAKTYTKYNELRGSSSTLLPIEIESVIEGFDKSKITINEVEYEVLKNESLDGLVVMYAMNIETGEKDYYQYDEKLNSFVRYNSKMYEKLSTQNKEFKLYLLATGGVAVIFFLLCLVLSSKISKLKKLIRKVSQSKTSAEVSDSSVEVDNSKEDSQEENDENILDEPQKKRKSKK